MLLTVDVGNTQTAVGLYEGRELVHGWRIATEKQHTADEIRAKLVSLLFADGIDAGGVEGAALASVVPRLTEAWRGAVRALFGVEALACSAQTAGSLFETNYPNPSEIGADRVADAVAAKALYGAPVVVVDFGTATNIEIIDKDGRFVGGIIAPGMETSSRAMFSNATKLAAVDLSDPGTVIGRSSEHAMRAGIVYGEADRADGLVRRVFEQLGYRTPVIATGGLAAVVAACSSEVTEVNTQLTLEGLRLIVESARE